MRPTLVNRCLPPWLLLAAGLCACAGTPPPVSPGPEIPSREEVFEAERLSKPASPDAIAAAQAYREKVCTPGQDISWVEKPPEGPACYGNPVAELQMLERLRAEAPDSREVPELLERMIETWKEIQAMVGRACHGYRVEASPTAGDVELFQQTLHKLNTFREEARTRPAELCAELRARRPYRPIEAPCPPVEGTSEPEGPASDAPSSDWF